MPTTDPFFEGFAEGRQQQREPDADDPFLQGFREAQPQQRTTAPTVAPSLEQQITQQREVGAAAQRATRETRPSLDPARETERVGQLTELQARQRQASARLQELRAQGIGQAVQNLGAEFVPGEGTAELGFAIDVVRSLRMADEPLLSIQQKLRSRFPDGDVISVLDPLTGQPVMLFTTDGKTFREIDPPGLDVGTAGNIASAFLSGATGGALAAGLATGPGALAPVAVGGGTLLGDVIDRAVERNRNLAGGTKGVLTREGILEAAIAALTERFFGPASGASAALQQRVLGGAMLDEAEQAQQAAGRQGLPDIVVGQALEQPVLRDLFRQVGALVAVPGRVTRKQLSAVKSRLETLATGDTGSLSSERLAEAVVLARENLDTELTRAARLISARGTPLKMLPEETATTLRTAFERWNRVTRAFRDRAYSRTRDAAVAAGGDLSYNVRAVQEEVNGWLTGRLFRELEGDPSVGLTREVIRVGPSGMSPALRSQLQHLRRLSPNIRAIDTTQLPKIPGRDPNVRTAFDQLKDLREELFQFRFSENGMDRLVANRVWHQLTRAMNEPGFEGVPTDAVKRVAELHKQAARLHAEREQTMELRMIARGFDDALTPEEFAERFLQPGRPTAVRLAQRMSGKFWTNVQHGFASQLHRQALDGGPEAVKNTLNRWRAQDPTGLNALMPREIQRSFDEWADGLITLDNTLTAQLAQQRLASAEVALQLANKVSTRAEANDLLRTWNAQQRQDFQRGLYHRMLQESSDPDGTISPDRLQRAVAGVRDNEALMQLLGSQGREVLNDLSTYVRVVKNLQDSGTALVRAQVTGQFGQIFSLRPMFASKRLSEARLWAEILSIPRAKAQMPQVPLGFTAPRLRGVAGASAVAAAQIVRQERERQNLPITTTPE